MVSGCVPRLTLFSSFRRRRSNNNNNNSSSSTAHQHERERAGDASLAPPAYHPAGFSLDASKQTHGGKSGDGDLDNDDDDDPALFNAVESSVFSLSKDLRSLSLQMFDLKETMFKEVKTHDLFCAWLEANPRRRAGWQVTRHAAGLPTAFRAEFEHRPTTLSANATIRTIGFNSELDALPAIGHACGHPLIAIAGLGAALACADALVQHDLPGRVVLLGTPAEEGGGGKVLMLNAGAYEGMDLCLMAHPGPMSTVGSTLAVTVFKVVYKGKASHAAAAPWEGVNALDAAVQAYVNIATLRQQVPPSHRMHGVIKGEGLAANVIPAHVELEFNARAPTKPELEALIPRVRACFDAAALATACDVEITVSMVYADLQNSSPLSALFRRTMASHYGDDFATVDIPGSTDFGDVSYALPALHPFYSIPLSDPKGGGNHTVAFERDARKPEAHDKTLQVAVAMALTGLKVVTDDAFASEVREKWEQWKKGKSPGP
ncbi:hypothetical protein OC844_005950 [Tilletia horrida]|nr:hypothetical protein OC844_005950 [Tilletia horrida]